MVMFINEHDACLLLLFLSVQCYAWTEYKFISVCVCDHHTFCQLAGSDLLTDFYSW